MASKTILERYITDIQRISVIDNEGSSKGSFVMTGDGMGTNENMSSEAYDDIVENYIAHCENQIQLAYEYLEKKNKFAARVDKNSKKLSEKADEVIDRICSETAEPDVSTKEDDIGKKSKKTKTYPSSKYLDDDYYTGNNYRASKKGTTTYYASSYKAPNKDNPEFHVYVSEEDFAIFDCHAEPIDDGFNTPYETDKVAKAYGHWRADNKAHNETVASAGVTVNETIGMDSDGIITDAELDRLIDEQSVHAHENYASTSANETRDTVIPLFKTLRDFDHDTKAFDAYIKSLSNEEFDMYVSQKDWNCGCISGAEWERLTNTQLDFVQESWKLSVIDDDESVKVIGTTNLSAHHDSPSDDAPEQYAID